MPFSFQAQDTKLLSSCCIISCKQIHISLFLSLYISLSIYIYIHLYMYVYIYIYIFIYLLGVISYYCIVYCCMFIGIDILQLHYILLAAPGSSQRGSRGCCAVPGARAATSDGQPRGDGPRNELSGSWKRPGVC